MQSSWHNQGKLRNRGLEKLSVFTDAKEITPHSTHRGWSSGPTGVLKLLSGAQ